MHISLTKRWGESVTDPEHGDLVAALEELSVHDPEHPDCWLENDNGWVISAFGDGLVILDGPTHDDGAFYMRAIPKEEILRLWKLLRDGQLDEIRRSPWVRGRPQIV